MVHKYKQNKTETTDTDYEHINRKKWELFSESLEDNAIILNCFSKFFNLYLLFKTNY